MCCYCFLIWCYRLQLWILETSTMCSMLRCIISSWSNYRWVGHLNSEIEFIFLHLKCNCEFSIDIWVLLFLISSCYWILLNIFQTILPPTTNIPEAYSHGSSEEQVSISLWASSSKPFKAQHYIFQILTVFVVHCFFRHLFRIWHCFSLHFTRQVSLLIWLILLIQNWKA